MKTRAMAVLGTLILFISLYYFAIERQNDLDRYFAKLQRLDQTPLTDRKGAVSRLKLMQDELNEAEQRMDKLLWMSYSGLVAGSFLMVVSFIIQRRQTDAGKEASAEAEVGAATGEAGEDNSSSAEPATDPGESAESGQADQSAAIGEAQTNPDTPDPDAPDLDTKDTKETGESVGSESDGADSPGSDPSKQD